jgi:hypothetical protein
MYLIKEYVMDLYCNTYRWSIEPKTIEGIMHHEKKLKI